MNELTALIILAMACPLIWLFAFFTGVRWGRSMAGNRLPPQPLQNTKVAIKKTFGPPEKPQNIKLPNLPGGIFEEFDEYQCGGYGHEDQFSSEVIENQVP